MVDHILEGLQLPRLGSSLSFFFLFWIETSSTDISVETNTDIEPARGLEHA